MRELLVQIDCRDCSYGMIVESFPTSVRPLLIYLRTKQPLTETLSEEGHLSFWRLMLEAVV